MAATVTVAASYTTPRGTTQLSLSPAEEASFKPARSTCRSPILCLGVYQVAPVVGLLAHSVSEDAMDGMAEMSSLLGTIY